jgi:hypothetical protein
MAAGAQNFELQPSKVIMQRHLVAKRACDVTARHSVLQACTSLNDNVFSRRPVPPSRDTTAIVRHALAFPASALHILSPETCLLLPHLNQAQLVHVSSIYLIQPSGSKTIALAGFTQFIMATCSATADIEFPESSVTAHILPSGSPEMNSMSRNSEAQAQAVRKLRRPTSLAFRLCTIDVVPHLAALPFAFCPLFMRSFSDEYDLDSRVMSLSNCSPPTPRPKAANCASCATSRQMIGGSIPAADML